MFYLDFAAVGLFHFEELEGLFHPDLEPRYERQTQYFDSEKKEKNEIQLMKAQVWFIFIFCVTWLQRLNLIIIINAVSSTFKNVFHLLIPMLS